MSISAAWTQPAVRRWPRNGWRPLCPTPLAEGVVLEEYFDLQKVRSLTPAAAVATSMARNPGRAATAATDRLKPGWRQGAASDKLKDR